MTLLEKLQEENLKKLTDEVNQITIISENGILLMQKEFISNIHLGITLCECITLIENSKDEYIAIIKSK